MSFLQTHKLHDCESLFTLSSVFCIAHPAFTQRSFLNRRVPDEERHRKLLLFLRGAPVAALTTEGAVVLAATVVEQRQHLQGKNFSNLFLCLNWGVSCCQHHSQGLPGSIIRGRKIKSLILTKFVGLSTKVKKNTTSAFIIPL